MRLSATFPLLPGLSLPFLGGASMRPAAPAAALAPQPVVPRKAHAVAAEAPGIALDDLDLDQRVRLSGEW